MVKQQNGKTAMREGYFPALNLQIGNIHNKSSFVPSPDSPETGRFGLEYKKKECYIPSSIGMDAPLINSKVQNTGYMSKVNYSPCSSSVAPGPNGVTEQTVKKLSWWEPNSFFRYNSMLISAFYGMKWKNNFREYFNIPDDFIIIGDSGGFQNMTQNANLNPIEVLRWQEKNCQIGLTFDLPLFENNYKVRREKMLKTAINADIAYKNRNNKNMKLYACFHGHSIEEQKFMIEKYNENTSLEMFDGIAYGGLVNSAGDTEFLIKILTLFCYNIKQYNKPVHFFGLSGNKILPYIIYLSRIFNLKITFDSSSYGAGAIRREFWLDNGKTKINCMTENFDKIPCDCPVCSVVIDFNEFKKDGSIAGSLISLHNLYQTIQTIEEIKNTELKLDNKYKRFIDMMKEKGPEYAFQILDKIPEQEQAEQKSIFSSL